MAAQPKRKQSTSRTNKRRNTKTTQLPTRNSCVSCGAPRRPHRACPSCGAYPGAGGTDEK